MAESETRGRPMIEPETVNLCKDCPDEPAPPVPLATITDLISEKPKKAWSFEWQVAKYDGEVTAEQAASGEVQPVEVVEIEGNIAVNSGINRMLDRFIGVSGQAADNTHTFMGVGDTAAVVGASDTDLDAATGATHRQWKGMDATFPSRSGQVLSFQATFSTTQANFAWLEAGLEVDDGTSSPGTAALSTGTQKLINHKAISAGTKTSAQTWICTGTLTLS